MILANEKLGFQNQSKKLYIGGITHVSNLTEWTFSLRPILAAYLEALAHVRVSLDIDMRLLP